MSNLLPPDGIKTARREYRLRVAATWGFLFAFAFAAAGGFLLPTFILVSVQFQSLEPLLVAGAEGDPAAYRANVAEIERAGNIAAHLRRPERGMNAAEAIAAVRGEVTSGITLVGINFTKEDEDTISLEARGVAATREALTAFVSALRRNPNFSDATVPVSELAEGVNAPFVATIVVQKQ